MLWVALAHAFAASACTSVQLLQSTHVYGLPSTEYVIDEHAPLASDAVHTVMTEPSEHVVPVVHDGLLLSLLPPEPEPEPEPEPLPLHALVASVSACAQSAQVAHWNEPPLISYEADMHTPFESCVVQN